jgi:hypothetical protein
MRELPIYRHAETKFLTQFPPRQTYGAFRGSMWPLVALTLIIIGLIDVATRLHHW